MAKESIIIPPHVPPLPRENVWSRNLPRSAAFDWLSAGWRDLTINPVPSLIYGLLVCVISIGIVGGLFWYGLDYILFPAFAGFMVVGPIGAVGLYEKSRRIEAGKPVTLANMVFVKAKSAGQILFTGVLLCGLMLLWMRAAVIIYALFFGLRPFPGLDHIAPMLFATPVGWAMLIVGSAVGGLFAAFSFAISAFSIPMLLNERDRHGQQYGAGLEQSAGDADLGHDRARAVPCEPCYRPARPDHRLPAARPRHVARLPRHQAKDSDIAGIAVGAPHGENGVDR